MVLKKSTAVFGAVVVALLIVCVGLLVALLKNQNQLSNKGFTDKSTASHITQTSGPTGSTNPPVTDDDFGNSTDYPNIPYKNYRLPRTILPIHYNLTLEPDLVTDHFKGQVSIEVNVLEPTRYFIVHSFRKKIKVTSAAVTNAAGSAVLVKKAFDYEPNEYFVMELNDEMGNGTYFLAYEFEGSLNGSIVGFYKSTYIDTESSQQKSLATSKFQPTYARRAYPCFDEPNFKSKFTVTLIHGSEYDALSNMPVEEVIEDTSKGLKTTKFATSVEMVTYLTCFVVSDFKAMEGLTANNITFRVFATPNQVKKTEFALQTGIKILDFYEKYFGIDFPLPKSDMIAIPDFSSGAMEHWGLITYRETNLLYDKKESSPQNKQRVASVISHELAHMWFGNLVTMEWWDDLWLNEGFASYIEYKGVHEVYPDWMMMDQILTEDMQSVIRLDSTTRSHPIIQPVNKPDEITEIFDAISYNKGAAVLRMLESFVSETSFQKGIRTFLEKYKYKNAKTAQLWEEIESASTHDDIGDVMDTWTKQMGLPYLLVVRIHNTKQFLIKQKRFLLNPQMTYSSDESPFNYVWKIPLSYVTSEGKSGLVWLNSTTIEHTIEGDWDWVKFNKEQAGYYIVSYSTDDWKKFSKIFLESHEKFTPSDRSGLLFDAFQLAQAEVFDYDIPLKMTTYLMNERHLTPWETAYSSFVQLGYLFQGSQEYEKFKTYLRQLTQPLYRTLGWKEQTKHTDSLLQTTIIGLACYSGNDDCRKQAVNRLKSLKEGKEVDIPLALRSIVFKYAIEADSSDELWEFMWDRYIKEESAQERVKLLYGLSHSQNVDHIKKLLDYARDSSKIRSQDFFTVLNYIAGNPKGRPIVWDFVRNDWIYLVDRFSINDRYLGRTVKTICDYFTTDAQLNEVIAFFDKYPEAGAGQRARLQTLENIQNNIRWLGEHQAQVSLWLEQNSLPWSDFRLSDDVIPIEYDLTLQPDMNGDTFKGHVTIKVNVMQNTKYFVVHADPNLMITKSEVRVPEVDDKPLTLQASFAHKANEFWVVEMERTIFNDTIVDLYYEFEGYLNQSLVGFYKSSYVDKNGTTKNLVTSQFQSTYARRAFPCFDEPKFKSVFKVHLIHPDGYRAISNMEQDGVVQLLPDGLKKTNFIPSVKMVTYLVCVTISDFEFKEQVTSNGIKVRVHSRPDEVNKLDYALHVGVKTLEYFENYFGIGFPLSKLDMVAIPDFQAGAMENWGLITYRETLLLYNENENSPYNQFRVTAVIGHEIAHMWFGNLVTMKWWDDLWLNEGFASYMEYKSMDSVEPTWDVKDQFFIEDMDRVLLTDASSTSHPIVQKVNHPDEISALFDAISYSKGASVLRMLEFFLGEVTFQKGVSKYLRTFQYSNAVTEDLWRYLADAAQEDGQLLNISAIMDTWTRQMGYPYLTVTKLSDTQYKLQQNRFQIETNTKKDDTSLFGYKWHIPVSYKTKTTTSAPIQWMSKDEDEITITVASDSQWTKFNADLTGYYLVDYKDQWSVMNQLLQTSHEDLSPSDRANLISDAFLLARAGHLDYTVALDLTKYLSKEKHFVPWETARKSLAYLMAVLEHNKDVDGQLKAYLETLTSSLMKELGWGEIPDHLTRRLREAIVDLACGSGNALCLNKAAELLKGWKNEQPIPPDLKLLVFEYGMKEIGDTDMWEHMLMKFKDERSSVEQRNLLFGLSCTKEPALLNKLLVEAEDPKVVRSQDYFTLLGYVAGNSAGLPIVWQYVKTNWLKLVDRFTISDRYLGNAVKSICSHFTTTDRLKEMKEFFALHPEAGPGERSRLEALENVQASINWLEKYQNNIHDWLKVQPKQPWHNVRLTDKVVPLEYDVKLRPFIEEGNFTGTVHITVDVKEPTKHFLVHTHLLDISSSTVKNVADGIDLPIESTFEYKENSFWVVELKNEAPIGKYVLSYVFSGSLLDKLYGFYRSSYVDKNTGVQKYLATSQFQSTYARQAFPCFDEPSIKSVFTVSLEHEATLTALSNMPVNETVETSPGVVLTKFNPSVPMVTYLVAVIVSDFTYKRNTTASGTEVRVYAPPDRIDEADFGLDIGIKVLENFENYFQIPYPLPKLDMIAIPDFRAGAMENWGLITYREAYLLFNKEKTSPSNEFSIVMIIAHEIAHMWFGNLVTMQWWDDLWLNEGFATFMAYKCVDDIRPDMNAIGLFLLGETSDVLEPDATLSSHPIVQEVNNPDEISAIFDAISYSKGASVLRKLETYLTPQIFRAGISEYLKTYSFKNAKTDDLWKALEEQANSKPVKEIMDTWTKQMGYPFLTVKFETDLKKAHLNQQRFLLNPESVTQEEETPSPYNYTWKIPIQVIHNGKEQEFMLETEIGTLDLASKIPDLSSSSMIKFNSRQSGYYLVNYEEPVWLKWSMELQDNSSIIHGNDRSNLLSDAFLLARAGYLKYDLALELSKYLKDETDLIPWTTARSGLSFVSNLLDSEAVTHGKMTEYLKSLSSDIYEKLGFDDSPDQKYIERRLRTNVADLACKSGHVKCLEEASKKLKNFIENNVAIPSAVRSLAFRYGVWHNDALWDPLWEMYLNETSSQAQRDFLSGLAYTQNEEQLKNFLQLGKDKVRTQDFLSVVTSIGHNPKGLQIAWDFIRKEWQYLVDRYTINDRSLGSSVLSICSHFKTEEKLKEMRQFFADNPDAGAGKSARQEALELVQGNIKWLSAHLTSVQKWLDTNVSS